VQKNTTGCNPSSSGEYGYAYNNLNLNRETKSNIVTVPNRRNLSPGPLNSTPPFTFSRSPGTSSAIRNTVLPRGMSASPPFHSHPLSLYANENSKDQATFNQKRGRAQHLANNPNLQGILLPPSSLEVLQASPFKTVSNIETSLASSVSGGFSHNPSCAGVGVMPQGVGQFAPSHEDGHFIGSPGSKGSPNPPSLITRSIYNNSGTNISFDNNQHDPYEEMPFADASACTDSSYSIHEGDASTASSFAYRCATGSRLQLFDKSLNTLNTNIALNNNSDPQTIKGVEGNVVKASSGKGDKNCGEMYDSGSQKGTNERWHPDDDIASQLADFHNFGASLANLQLSTHRGIVIPNNSLSDSGSVKRTSVA